MRKILSIVGARPQFIKHFPLEMNLKKYFKVLTVHTGQHYDEKMSSIFFEELKMDLPSYRFDLSKTTHAGQTGEILQKVEDVIQSDKPDGVLVYGDTNSTLAGALAAAKMNIRVIHVESGLRSFNRAMPEEINRVMTDHISDYLFCSSLNGVLNLKKEGITKNVFQCGDLMKDALRIIQPSLKAPRLLDYVFCTLHRPYNTDSKHRIYQILEVLNNLNKNVVFPVHPRTLKILSSLNNYKKIFNRIEFIEPVGYLESLSFQKFAECVITDSGGIQKEAYWLKTKCITIRSETEWTETLVGGWNTLVFSDLDVISKLIREIPNEEYYQSELYGDSYSAEEISNKLQENF